MLFSAGVVRMLECSIVLNEGVCGLLWLFLQSWAELKQKMQGDSHCVFVFLLHTSVMEGCSDSCLPVGQAGLVHAGANRELGRGPDQLWCADLTQAVSLEPLTASSDCIFRHFYIDIEH